jgi:hypothetical protein
MDEVAPPVPDATGCLVARIDYGFDGPLKAGWRTLDLQREPLPELRTPAEGPGLVIQGSDLLLGWARTRGGRELWLRLCEAASRSGLVLECRFPRNARALARQMGALGSGLRFWETRPGGQIPPLYQRLRDQPQLASLHLRHEWWTGMGAARGGIALLRVALELSAVGPCAAPALAMQLGITAGATRSYLRWMEDAALLRREGQRFDLRHPLLGSLFDQRGPRPKVQPRTVSAQSRPWNHLELD